MEANINIDERITALSAGNPGAYNVCHNMYGQFGTAPLDKLNELNIRGSDIWVLYKDICREDIIATMLELNSGTAVGKLSKNRSSSFYQNRRA